MSTRNRMELLVVFFTLAITVVLNSKQMATVESSPAIPSRVVGMDETLTSSRLVVPNDADSSSIEYVGGLTIPAWNVVVVGSRAYVTDITTGLHIVDVADPAAPKKLGSYDTPGNAASVAVAGNYAYVADFDGLRVINVANPTAPFEVGYYDAPWDAWDVVVVGNYAYLADDMGGLRIINVADPAKPREVGFYDNGLIVYAVAVAGDYAYVTGAGHDLEIINIANPTAPFRVGTFWQRGNYSEAIAIAGDYAYVANDMSNDPNGGLSIINIVDPAHPAEAGYYEMSGYAGDVVVAGNYAYVTDLENGVHVLDIANVANPTPAGFYDTPGKAWHVALGGGYIYVADESSLLILRFSGTAEEYSISGRAQTQTGSPVSGVRICTQTSQCVTTNTNGNYTVSGLPAGAYSLSASLSGYTFTPPSRAATVPPNATGVDFTGTASTYSISGRIQNQAGAAMVGANVCAQNGLCATTNSAGDYSFINLPAGGYTLTATKSGYTFTPASRAVTVPPSATGVNFTGAALTYSISGRVRDQAGAAIADVQICTQSANCVTTNTSGNYNLGNLAAGSYTLTATKAGYWFTPPSTSVTVPPSRTGVDFTRTHPCTTVADAGVQPIMFVTGWGGSDEGESMLYHDDQLKYFADHLAPHGYVAECNAFYVSDTSPYRYLIDNAEFIQNELCSAYARVRLWNPNFDGHFSIIGHSYGGLRARAYLEGLGDPTRKLYGKPCADGYTVSVDNLFTLGTPHNGEAGVLPFSTVIGSLALWGREWPALKEMLPPKRVLQNWQARQPRDTRYYFIGGDARNQVLPPTSPLSIAYWKSKPAQVMANDFAVYQISALGLSLPSERYPSVFRLTTDDLHGQVPFWLDPLGLLRSYVNPSDTFERQMCSRLNLSGCGTVALDVPSVSSADMSVGTMVAELQEPIVSAPQSMTEIAAGELSGSGIKEGVFQVGGSGQWQVMLNWISGELNLTLTDPAGRQIDPAVAETDAAIDYYELDTGFGVMAAYSFNNAKQGEWAYAIGAAEQATPYRLVVMPPLPIEVSTSLPQWSPAGTPVIINALLAYDGTTPVVGGSVVADILKPDGQEATVALFDDGAHHDGSPNDGKFGGTYTPPATGGSFSLMILAEGTYSGKPYQRHATAFFDVAPRSVALTGSYTDRGMDRNGDGKFESLEVTVGLRVNRPGVYGVAGELYRDSTFIGTTYFESALGSGTQRLAFEFSAEDILAAQRNGPYTVRNIMLTDENDITLLVEVADFVHTTAAYAVTDFSSASRIVQLPVILNSSSNQPPPTNLALNRPAFATSDQPPYFITDYGNDGDQGTRWSSTSGQWGEWWMVDLGSTRAFNQVKINWEAAYATSYAVRWSNGPNCTDPNSYVTGILYGVESDGWITHNIGTRTARCIAVEMMSVAPGLGNYSFWELEVYNVGGLR